MRKAERSPFSFDVQWESGLFVGWTVDRRYVVLMGRRVAGGNPEGEVVRAHGGIQVTI